MIWTNQQPTRDAAVLDVIQRLSETKRQSVTFLDGWRRETNDADVRAGLEAQLLDERRHTRLLAEQVKRLAAQHGVTKRATVGRLFDEVSELDTDLHRMCAFHRGVKAFSLNRCSHLTGLVDAPLAAVLEQVASEDERHIRWADVRLSRLLTHAEMRTCNLLMGRVWAVLEASWEKSWRELTTSASPDLFPEKVSS